MPAQYLASLRSGVKVPLRLKFAFAALVIFHAIDFALRDRLARRNRKGGA